jgi:hypothetical protein
MTVFGTANAVTGRLLEGIQGEQCPTRCSVGLTPFGRLERLPVISKHFPAPSWPGMARRKTRVNALTSRPPRLLWRCASTIGVAGTDPAMTAHV